MTTDVPRRHWADMRRGTQLVRALLSGLDGLALVSLAMLVALLLLGLFGTWLPLPDPDAIGARGRLAPPGAEGGLLGADNLGRDMLARIIQGIRNTFVVASTAVLITALVGAALGMIAGYWRGWLDEVLARLADVIYSFPAVLMGLLITAVAGPGSTSVILAIVLVTLPPMLRIVRVAVQEIAGADFVLTAKVFGASHWRILFVHLLPNVLLPILTQAAYSVSIGILVESALSFLGLGVQPPAASLGSILREGSTYINAAPWLVAGPGFFLVLTILSINLLGEGLRGLVDPLRPRELDN